MENRETMARQCQGLRLEQSRLRAAVAARLRMAGETLEETDGGVLGVSLGAVRCDTSYCICVRLCAGWSGCAAVSVLLNVLQRILMCAWGVFREDVLLIIPFA